MAENTVVKLHKVLFIVPQKRYNDKKERNDKNMVKFEFFLSDKDYDRMEIIKERMGIGKADMTMNEFAKELLENELYRLQPKVPVESDE